MVSDRQILANAEKAGVNEEFNNGPDAKWARKRTRSLPTCLVAVGFFLLGMLALAGLQFSYKFLSCNKPKTTFHTTTAEVESNFEASGLHSIEKRADGIKDFYNLHAVQVFNHSWIFFADNNGYLSYYKSPQPGPEMPDELPYAQGTVIMGKKPIQVRGQRGTAEVAAIAFRNPKQMDLHRLRVYYIDTSGILNEVCKDGPGDWFVGSLGASKIYAAPSSGLSASVRRGQQEVFFYNDDTPKQVSRAYVGPHPSKWVTGTITELPEAH